MYDVARVEFVSDLYRRIAGVTTRFEFTAPVEDDDLATVRAELAAAVPGYQVSVDRADPHVLVEVHAPDGGRLYARSMIVRS